MAKDKQKQQDKKTNKKQAAPIMATPRPDKKARTLANKKRRMERDARRKQEKAQREGKMVPMSGRFISPLYVSLREKEHQRKVEAAKHGERIGHVKLEKDMFHLELRAKVLQ